MKSGLPYKAILIALAFLAVALFVNYYATLYATERASNYVEDIVLSNIPTLDVDGTFLVGPLIFWAVVVVVMLRYPKTIPFTINSIALLLLIRSGFLSLTHFGIFPDHIEIAKDYFGLYATGADMFFSGHTAFPFMMALVFWNRFWMRVFCIAASVFFGVIVLLAHVHYSIDVAAAFFITYTVYEMAIRLFRKEKALFDTVIVQRLSKNAV